MDQPQVELLVRLTARLSGAAFVAALILGSVRGPHRRAGVRYGIRVWGAFILVHTVHFGTVLWLAILTAGQNIRIRGGGAVVLPVAALFYFAAFAVLRAWSNLDAGRDLPRGGRLAADASVALIALIFLNSYIGRVGRMPVYWTPAILMIAAVVMYFTQVHRVEGRKLLR